MSKKILQAELWDKMHYLFRDFNDRMVHVELHYDFEIDIDILKTVLICFFEKAPVLHSSFKDNKISAVWEIKDYNIDDILIVERPENLQKAIDEFLTQYIPPESDLQMKVAVFYHDGKSVLCIVENHMCMDGGDFKYFIKALCEAYTGYALEKKSPVELRTGTRAYTSVYDDYSKTEQRMAKNLYKNVCAKDDHKFPLTHDSIRDVSFIAKRKLSAEMFDKIKSTGKKHGATINDMILTAYFYSLYELAGYHKKESVTISCAIDLRRHIKDNSDEGLTNHTAFMQCNIPGLGENIFDTLGYVVQSSERYKKDKFMGLYGLPLLNFGYSILPQAASEAVIKVGYSNPLLAMSNIGILDHKALSLCGNEPTDGFMTGAVKYKPFVLLSVTTMRKEMTLSMCVRGNEEDRKTVERFFDLIEENLKKLIKE
ncbi:MAG: condensation domain-containing protein [Acutalibacteraceae bacterium]